MVAGILNVHVIRFNSDVSQIRGSRNTYPGMKKHEGKFYISVNYRVKIADVKD